MDNLLYNQKNAYELLDEKEIKVACDYCEGYKKYLDAAKTERLAVKEAVKIAESEGFSEFCRGKVYKSGDKIYKTVRSKALMLAVIGKEPIENGMNIAGAHVDSPRLDLKQVPMYEDSEIAYFKTHYYGGIKKYQWVTVPLALYGVVSMLDGSLIEVSIGDDESDPVFVISDLLPHLSADQNKKSLSEGISGEALNIVIGSAPTGNGEKDKVKLAVLDILNKKYGITEEDFQPFMNIKSVATVFAMLFTWCIT